MRAARLVPFVAVVAAAAAVVAALTVGGGAPQPSAAGLPDAGPVVGWTLPIVGLLARLASVATIGFLIAATFLLPNRGDNVEGLSAVAVTRAATVATAWSVATFAQYILTVADVFGRPLHALSFPLLWTLAADTSLGRALIVQAVAAGLVALACRWTVSVRHLAACVGVAILALLPVTLTGHTAATAAHDLATTSLFIHVAAASVWVGGLAAMVWVAIRGSTRLPSALSRYAAVATWASIALALAGVL